MGEGEINRRYKGSHKNERELVEIRICISELRTGHLGHIGVRKIVTIVYREDILRLCDESSLMDVTMDIQRSRRYDGMKAEFFKRIEW